MKESKKIQTKKSVFFCYFIKKLEFNKNIKILINNYKFNYKFNFYFFSIFILKIYNLIIIYNYF